MKRIIFALILASSLLLAFSTGASAQTQHSQHHAIPFSTCKSAPDDSTCDGQDPSSTGCTGDQRLIHTSGWYDYIGTLMGTSLWRSDKCKSVWSATNASSGTSDYSSHIRNTSDSFGYWTSECICSHEYTPMMYASGEYAYGEARDDVNNTYHVTPTYPF